MVPDAIAFDGVAHPAGQEDAVALGEQGHVDGWGVGAVVVVDEVADQRGLPLGVAQLVAAAVGHDAGAVVPERRVHDVEVAAGVRPRVAEAVVLADDGVHHRVAGVALPDVEAGVGAAAPVGVVELSVDGVERVDAVVAVAVGGQVGPPVSLDPGPEEPVDGVVPRGHVLDGDAVGLGHADAVLEFEPAVEDHLVAIEAADGELVGGDVDGLGVLAGRDQDQVAGDGRVDGLLDGAVVVGHVQRGRVGALLAVGAVSVAAAVCAVVPAGGSDQGDRGEDGDEHR